MSEYTNQQIIDAFRSNNSKVIDDIYVMYFPMIKKLVSANSVNVEAEDIMSDAMIEIIYSIDKKPDFNLTYPFKSLLYRICKTNLIDKYRKEKSYTEVFSDTYDFENELIDDFNIDFIHKDSKRYSLFLKHFANINEKCQTLMSMFLDKIPIKDIANKLGLSEKFVKKRKFECKKMLIHNITKDPDFKNLKF